MASSRRRKRRVICRHHLKRPGAPRWRARGNHHDLLAIILICIAVPAPRRQLPAQKKWRAVALRRHRPKSWHAGAGDAAHGRGNQRNAEIKQPCREADGRSRAAGEK